LLLVRLGLRASEVRSLTLDDIDWHNGQLTIHGKGRGPEQLPLLRDVGSALAAYLANSRAVTSIAGDTIRAAGVDVPCKGAHVFRHSLATRMLRDGASLREIGHVLRHRDEDTTRIYAKVDLTRLRTLALSWPGGAS
jgi:integrase